MPTGSTKSRRNKQQPRAEAATAAETGASKRAERDAPPARGVTSDALTQISDRAWLISSAVILFVAALFRVVELELKPLHHDEGVNGFFLLGLLRHGNYVYNPTNYHGPTLYYFTLPLAYIADSQHFLSAWVLRAVTVAFGVATVWLALSLRRYIGAVGTLACAALLAVSPGMVFFSRYYIHEMLFVFFTLGIIVGALRFYDYEAVGEGRADKFGTGTLGLGIAAAAGALVAVSFETAKYYATLTRGWTTVFLFIILVCLAALVTLLWLYDGARSFYLALASACAALMFATKETAFISAGVLLIAWVMSSVWVRREYYWLKVRAEFRKRFGMPSPPELREKKGRDKRKSKSRTVSSNMSEQPLNLVERFGGWTHILFLLVAALGIFCFVNIIYYSSFFTNPKGVKDSLEALNVWGKTGESGFHGYPLYKYVEWLVGSTPQPPAGATHGIFEYVQWVYDNWHWEFGEEAPLILLAAVGAVLSVWKARRRFPLFAALWGFGLFAAYSIIKYKTPWLALSWLLPLAIAGGYAIDRLYRARGWRAPALALLGACLAVAAYQAYEINFVHYDDDAYAYVYAHTKRSFHELIGRMEEIAARTGDKYNAGIAVDVENQEYWPLPWYVRDYKHIGYNGKVVETNDAVILVKTSQVGEVESLLGSRYVRVGDVYALRPGVDLALFGRRDLVNR
ncbi:MAG: hypothetical protein ACJ741_17665 [Pyrinomonadaceae bacterium]